MGQGVSDSVLSCNCSCSKEQEVNFRSTASCPAAGPSSRGYETAGVVTPERKLFPGGDTGDKAWPRISTASTQAGTSTGVNSPPIEKRGSQSGDTTSSSVPTTSTKIEFNGSKRPSNADSKRPSTLSCDTPKHDLSVNLSSPARRPSTLSTNSSQVDEAVSESSSSGDDDVDDCPEFLRPRRGAFCVGKLDRRVYQPPSYSKDADTKKRLLDALGDSCIFKNALNSSEMEEIVNSMSITDVSAGEQILQQGAPGDAMFVVLKGTVECFLEKQDGKSRRNSFITSRGEGAVFGEVSIICSMPRALSVYAKTSCTFARLECEVYQNLVVQRQYRKRERREACLRTVKLLELLDDEMIAKLADALMVKAYKPGDTIISQGEDGKEFFIVQSGECVAEVMTFGEMQEVKRYGDGDLFGELALLKNAKRAATVTATTHVEAMYINRRSFERMLGPLRSMMKSQYLLDPRKLIADFYRPGDHRGPYGSLAQTGLEPEPDLGGPSYWFAVFRPTSKDAIAKMLNGFAVGKGLNVKGKSAKKNFLSGYVPFMQIMDNDHKDLIEELPSDARVRVFYKTEVARGVALSHLMAVRDSMMENRETPRAVTNTANVKSFAQDLESLRPPEERIDLDDNFAPKVLGLDMPGNLLREAYIMRSDLSPQVGWETGRSSEPAFMDMNLHAVTGESEPEVVLFQYDEGHPLNPHGLLIAYAEATVKPVVSDFDAFLIASKGMEFSELPPTQADLMNWSLEKATEVLESPSGASWTSRWLEILKRESDEGFHPDIPKYGFGDPTSYRLISDVVQQTAGCGAVRHGAECFNFYFPQELDDQYLVVWEGFAERPWEYKSESELRSFLIQRVADGFSFPLNPVWPVRDAAWYEVWDALRKSPVAQSSLNAWYPPNSGIVARIENLHEKYPNGFVAVDNSPTKKKNDKDRPSLNREEEADMGYINLFAAAPSRIQSPHRRMTGVVQQMLHVPQNVTSIMNWMPKRRISTERKTPSCELEQAGRSKSADSHRNPPRRGWRSISPRCFRRSTGKSSNRD